MTYKLTLLENFLASTNVLPHPVIDSLTQIVAGRALQASVKLGIIEALNKKSLSEKELATKVDISQEGLVVLLDCLDALGYVQKLKSEKFSLTARGKKFLAKDSKSSLTNVILFTDYVFETLKDLESNLKRGGPRTVNLDVFTTEQWAVFNRAMAEIASSNASEIVKLVPFTKTYKKLLDLGGSHGIHSIAFCKKYPNLAAEVLDLEQTKSQAEKIIKENKMAKRVKFKVGDFLRDRLVKKYDVVLAFNVIHGINSLNNTKLAKKVYQALNPGGIYVIMDQIKDVRGKSQLSKLIATTMGIMLFNQAGGKTYTFDEVKDWISKIGFKKVIMKKLREPGSALIIGYK